MVEKKERYAQIFFGVYCAFLIIQNILACKSIDIWVFTVTTGIFVSPFVFIVNDLSCELFGYKQTKRMILLAFFINFIAMLLYQLAIFVPSSANFANQQAIEVILGTTPRITIASFLAYVTGSLINSKIMVKMRERNEKTFFARAITSTIFGQLVDNAIFAFVAFLFVLPIEAVISMVIGGTIFEVIYEIIFFPITKKTAKTLKKRLEMG